MSKSEEEVLDDFLKKTVEHLRAARGDADRVRAAIQTYLEEGDTQEMSPLELRDYFDISDPGLPEQAGYSADEQDEATRLYEEVSGGRHDRG